MPQTMVQDGGIFAVISRMDRFAAQLASQAARIASRGLFIAVVSGPGLRRYKASAKEAF